MQDFIGLAGFDTVNSAQGIFQFLISWLRGFVSSITRQIGGKGGQNTTLVHAAVTVDDLRRWLERDWR